MVLENAGISTLILAHVFYIFVINVRQLLEHPLLLQFTF